MARMARVVAESVPHHITQRGNDRREVFLLAADRRFYLETPRAKCGEHGVALLGYCLMTDPAQRVAIPERTNSCARALGQTDGRYASWFNRRYRRSGHLWQSRFYSCALGRTDLLAALAYVDLNAVRAGLTERAGEYEWSSAKAHVAEVESDALLDGWVGSELRIGGDWEDVLRTEDDEARASRLRRASDARLPFGDDAFVAEMEARVGRELRRRRPGPQPRRETES